MRNIIGPYYVAEQTATDFEEEFNVSQPNTAYEAESPILPKGELTLVTVLTVIASLATIFRS